MENAELIDDKFRNDIRNTSLFMELLRCKHALFSSLRRMKRYGVLGRYIPAFGAIIGQMQYEDSYRLAYIRGPEGIVVGLAEPIGQA